MAFVGKTVRSILFMLDKVIYGLIADVYSLLMVITRTTIFSNADIAEFSSRIYAIAGIFMLFKISLSVINYIVNPDSFTDKEKGMASIGKRIVISLVMLVLVPYIFQEAYQLQSIILEENTIMTLVFGSTMKNGLPNESYVSNAGKNMQFTLMYTFMQPNVSEMSYHKDYPLEVCSETYVWENGKIKHRADSNTIFELNPLCFGTYTNDSYSGGVLSNAFADGDVKLNDVYQNYAIGIATQNFDIMMREDVVLAKYDDIYLIDYKVGVSTVVGVVVVYILLLFCIDIAVRSVKLGFLQMIAPIPILSYIDPKSGKDGMLTKWRKTCVSTYLSLFLRLFALYMGIYAITIIGSYTDVITGEKIQGNWLLDVFMMIGILIFAKSLPKIVEEISGMKASGKFTLNPFKKFQEEAFGGKQILAAGGAGLAGTAAFGVNLLAKKNPFSAVAGAVSATGRGLFGVARGNTFGKNFSNSYKGAMTARQNRADRKELGIHSYDILNQRRRQAMGLATKDQIYESQIKRYKEATDALGAAKKRAEGEVDKKADSITTSTGKTLGQLREAHELWKNMDAQQYAASHGISESAAVAKIAQEAAAANSTYFKARKDVVNQYVEASVKGRLKSEFMDGNKSVFDTDVDVTVTQNVNRAQSAVDSYDLRDVNDKKVKINVGKISDASQALEDASTQIQSSNKYRQAQVIAQQTQKQKK